ncbi:MAG: hypothetical protein GY929_21330 [Actinomycetia bacterium]|nr:hypothetical protein [Actinomycetes bacterium]
MAGFRPRLFGGCCSGVILGFHWRARIDVALIRARTVILARGGRIRLCCIGIGFIDRLGHVGFGSTLTVTAGDIALTHQIAQ